MNKDIKNDLDEIEEEVKEEEQVAKKTHHKVSGKSVFELQEIIAKRGTEASRGNSFGIIKKKAEEKHSDKEENKS